VGVKNKNLRWFQKKKKLGRGGEKGQDFANAMVYVRTLMPEAERGKK